MKKSFYPNLSPWHVVVINSLHMIIHACVIIRMFNNFALLNIIKFGYITVNHIASRTNRESSNIPLLRVKVTRYDSKGDFPLAAAVMLMCVRTRLLTNNLSPPFLLPSNSLRSCLLFPSCWTVWPALPPFLFRKLTPRPFAHANESEKSVWPLMDTVWRVNIARVNRLIGQPMAEASLSSSMCPLAPGIVGYFTSCRRRSVLVHPACRFIRLSCLSLYSSMSM